jgi:hypothetical protein
MVHHHLGLHGHHPGFHPSIVMVHHLGLVAFIGVHHPGLIHSSFMVVHHLGLHSSLIEVHHRLDLLHSSFIEGHHLGLHSSLIVGHPSSVSSFIICQGSAI